MKTLTSTKSKIVIKKNMRFKAVSNSSIIFRFDQSIENDILSAHLRDIS